MPRPLIAAVFLILAAYLGLAMADADKIYSNGWYGYAISYSPDVQLSYNGSLFVKGAILDSTIMLRRGGPGSPSCHLEVSMWGPTRGVEGVHQSEPVTYNGISWKKEEVTYAINDRGVTWTALNGQFAYSFFSDRRYAQFCETIVATFKFEVDGDVPSAAEALGVKKVAMTFAADHYPEKVFAGGAFIDSTETHIVQVGDMTAERILRTTPRATVDFVDHGQWGRRARIGLLLEQKRGEWMVTGETEPIMSCGGVSLKEN